MKITIERKFSNRPSEARRFATAMSCLAGHKTTQIIEELDDDGVVIRTRLETAETNVLDHIKQAVLDYSDSPSMPLFDQMEKMPTPLAVGDRVRIVMPEDTGLFQGLEKYAGREGTIMDIAEESETPFDVRFDLGYPELSGLFKAEHLERIPEHELQVGDVCRVVNPYDDNDLVVATPDENSIVIIASETEKPCEGAPRLFKCSNGQRYLDERLVYIRPSRLCVGDPVTWKDEEDFIFCGTVARFERNTEGETTVWVARGNDMIPAVHELRLNLLGLVDLVDAQLDTIRRVEEARKAPMEPADCSTSQVTEDDLRKAQETLDDHMRLNHELLHREHGWSTAKAISVINEMRRRDLIPTPGDPQDDQVVELENAMTEPSV